MAIHLSGAESILAKALEDFERRFEGTHSAWRDKARNDFEAEHIQPLRDSIRKAQHTMRNVEELLRQVVKECS